MKDNLFACGLFLRPGNVEPLSRIVPHELGIEDCNVVNMQFHKKREPCFIKTRVPYQDILRNCINSYKYIDADRFIRTLRLLRRSPILVINEGRYKNYRTVDYKCVFGNVRFVPTSLDM